jgi:site-specific DNA-methyltransferase (adenine-specific)
MNLIPAFVASPEINKVYNVDALTLLRAMPAGSIDAIITDPPYGVGTQVSQRRVRSERFTEIANADFVDATWLPEAYRAMKQGGALYAFAKWLNVGEWIAVIKSTGFDVRNCIIWDKMQHGTGDLYGAYAPMYEMIIFAVKDSHRLRGKRPVDIIRHKKIPQHDLIHPYEKPVALLERLILASTDEGGLVVDCFMGSGSTVKAAYKNRRSYIGCDVDNHYVNIAAKGLSYGYTPSFMPILEQSA